MTLKAISNWEARLAGLLARSIFQMTTYIFVGFAHDRPHLATGSDIHHIASISRLLVSVIVQREAQASNLLGHDLSKVNTFFANPTGKN
jgi:hypothetical protein